MLIIDLTNYFSSVFDVTKRRLAARQAIVDVRIAEKQTRRPQRYGRKESAGDVVVVFWFPRQPRVIPLLHDSRLKRQVAAVFGLNK